MQHAVDCGETYGAVICSTQLVSANSGWFLITPKFFWANKCESYPFVCENSIPSILSIHRTHHISSCHTAGQKQKVPTGSNSANVWAVRKIPGAGRRCGQNHDAGLAMDCKKDRAGKFEGAAFAATPESLPAMDFCKTRQDKSGFLAVPSLTLP